MQTERQHHWRCAHHPSSIDNLFAGRTTCEWECHTQELRWHHNGTHPLPPSWPAHPWRGSLSAIRELP